MFVYRDDVIRKLKALIIDPRVATRGPDTLAWVILKILAVCGALSDHGDVTAPIQNRRPMFEFILAELELALQSILPFDNDIGLHDNRCDFVVVLAILLTICGFEIPRNIMPAIASIADHPVMRHKWHFRFDDLFRDCTRMVTDIDLVARDRNGDRTFAISAYAERVGERGFEFARSVHAELRRLNISSLSNDRTEVASLLKISKAGPAAEYSCPVVNNTTSLINEFFCPSCFAYVVKMQILSVWTKEPRPAWVVRMDESITAPPNPPEVSLWTVIIAFLVMIVVRSFWM
jgi:hypothetical protein